MEDGSEKNNFPYLCEQIDVWRNYYKVRRPWIEFRPDEMPHLDVANLGGLRTEACRLAGDGEEGRHPQRHPARHVLHVHPEADPGHDHDEDGRNVGLDQVKPNTSVQLELCCQTTVVT